MILTVRMVIEYDHDMIYDDIYIYNIDDYMGTGDRHITHTYLPKYDRRFMDDS